MKKIVKKIVKIMGIVDAIALIIIGMIFFLFDYNFISVLPVLLTVLIVCILIDSKH